MAAVVSTYALTSVQKGMLFHHLSAPNAGVDIEQIVGSLREKIDAVAFRRAWERVASRHGAFRTALRWEELEEPLQDVHEQVTLPLRVEDWRDCPVAEQETRLTEYLRTDRLRGFHLTRPPLVRLALFRVGDAEHRLVWTFHHLLMDGRSFSLVLGDVFAFYDALRSDGDQEREPARSFGEHIRWLSERDRTHDEAFWRPRLEGFTPCSLFSPEAPTASADDQIAPLEEPELHLPEGPTRALRRLAKENGLTLNTIVQGAWAIVLSHYTREERVLFGAVRAGRKSIDGADAVVGMFINTLPVAVRVCPQESLVPWLRRLRDEQLAVRPFEHTPLVDIQRWSEVPSGQPLFESVIVFDHACLGTVLKSQGGDWLKRDFHLLERTNFPLTLYAYGERELLLSIAHDPGVCSTVQAQRMLGHLRVALEAMANEPARNLGELPILTEVERHLQLVTWNETDAEFPRDTCIHDLIELQVTRTPDAVAAVFEEEALTYWELNERADQLARRLRQLDVGPEVLVGISVDRSLDMLVGILGVLKAGGAYLPLDPEYPRERLAFILEDAGVPVLLTQASLLPRLPTTGAKVVLLDEDSGEPADEPSVADAPEVAAHNLAYVIYTSGSTGRPKGVMIEHRNVVNFFVAMDERVPHDPPGTWLAVTSLSFDISVLELLWTLARGFKVVILPGGEWTDATARVSPPEARRLDFSLFYFSSSDGGQGGDKYRLLVEGAKFADRNEFLAVWTPERHFHDFGGLYPNPAVAGAALATITERIRIRSGSVVLPLHNPIRVAEEWAVVDNLSGGRVDISAAAGWQPNDFVLAPENYADRKALLYRQIETVRRLWRGEAVAVPGPHGNSVEIRTLPRPVQAELPVWVTTAGNVDTYRAAGARGFNVLTHLLGQSVEELGEKIAAYRQAWTENGHGPGDGCVSLMLHTLVGATDNEARELARRPMMDYLGSSMSLVKNFADAWTAFSKRAKRPAAATGDEFDELSEEDRESLLAFAFERYFETSGLFGTPEKCLQLVEELRAVGVDEIACLIDFGVETEIVLRHLRYLNEVRKRAQRAESRRAPDSPSYSVPALVGRHQVTTMQCTPSLARMLLADAETRNALRQVETLLIGGEALAADLAAELQELVRGDVINMYGPTETTIWSSTHLARGSTGTVPIGRPVTNTKLYVLNRNRQPAPVGVAGELYIGGRGVARGYLNRPELTAARFIADPFNGHADARLYRTGDVVRYAEDGTLEFLGRTDHQVKVRGHRIELGEIETVLSRHPKLKEVVVELRELHSGGPQLVGYYTTVPGTTIGDEELRRFSVENLPDYMLPTAFVGLDSFPLTPNQKVDRGRLPAPDQARSELARAFTPARTPTEATLTQIWCEVLGFERIGIHDDFFQLGGNSLSTIQIAFKIRQTLHTELPLSAIFKHPTVAGLADRLEQELLDQADDSTLARLLEEIEEMTEEEARVFVETAPTTPPESVTSERK